MPTDLNLHRLVAFTAALVKIGKRTTRPEIREIVAAFYFLISVILIFRCNGYRKLHYNACSDSYFTKNLDFATNLTKHKIVDYEGGTR